MKKNSEKSGPEIVLDTENDRESIVRFRTGDDHNDHVTAQKVVKSKTGKSDDKRNKVTRLQNAPEIVSSDRSLPVRLEDEDDSDNKEKKNYSNESDGNNFKITQLPNGPEIVFDDTEEPVRLETVNDADCVKDKTLASVNNSTGYNGPGAYSISPRREDESENTVITSVASGNFEDGGEGRNPVQVSTNENIDSRFAAEEATNNIDPTQEEEKLLEKSNNWKHKLKIFWSVKRNRYIILVVLLVLIVEAVTLGVVFRRKKQDTPPDISFIVFSSKGVNAAAIAEDSKAQEILGNTLVQGLSSDSKLSISVSNSSFVNVIEALSGTSFSDLTYELELESTNIGSSAIKMSVERMATSGELTKISNRLDTNNNYGFIFEAVSLTAIYDIAITVEYECTSTTDLKNEKGVDNALKEYHEYLNKAANQGFKNIIITNTEITSGPCKTDFNSQRDTQYSKVEYKLPVECVGQCPAQGIPPIESINRRRRLVQLFDDPIPGLKQLVEAFDANTNVKVKSAQTDKNANRLIGCNIKTKCEAFTNIWVVAATLSPESYSGFSVDLSADGKSLVVGNQQYDEARVHQRNANYFENRSWPQIGQTLKPGDEAGYDVSISEDGNTVATGAYRYNKTGRVRVYTKSLVNSTFSEWLQKGQDLVGDNINDAFGVLVELANNGNTILIGADMVGDFESENRTGYARIYDFQGKMWVARGNVLSGKSLSAQFGNSGTITEDGNHVCISAHKQGEVFCYTWKNVNSIWQWYEKGSVIIGSADVWFGYSVALSKQSGNTLVIGSVYESEFQSNPTMFPSRNPALINEFTNFPTTTPPTAPFFENSLDESIKQGTAHIYEYDGKEWRRTFTTLYGNYSGWSVDVSNDESTVVVGGDLRFSRVHVYRRKNGKWTKLGESLPGHQDTAVSLSRDGNFLAIGLQYGDSRFTGVTNVYKWIQ